MLCGVALSPLSALAQDAPPQVAASSDAASSLEQAEQAAQRMLTMPGQGPSSPAPVSAEAAEQSLRSDVTLLDAAIALEPTNPRWHLARSAARLRLREAPGAVADAREAIALDATNADAHERLGMALFASTGRDRSLGALDTAKQARDALERAVALDPGPARSWARFAVCQFYIQAPGIAGGSYSKARAHARALLALPDGQGQFLGHLILAQVAQHDEDWRDMSKAYEAAEQAGGIGANPTWALQSHARALLLEKKDAALAQPVVERLALRSDVEPTSLLFLKGELARLQRDCATALTHYQAALAIREDLRMARFGAAECAERLGERAQAAEHYTQFAERFPEDDRASTARRKARQLTQ